ncbi:branched-chain amino acid ABC transporter substrate-binding protein (plasmid) [Bartonella sp. HY329]|uniref:branched-chain amino acid ABC transporter substrate-binding protein n=1 Tax=unclassified Bartonella TaxID=2645622 RepID=UPI0021C61F17|nr:MULTISPECIES: branched-chain amino acid ABC transporter substrate-binding protein [unclassified Bartonella]UXM96537.1 branched-chain amino acid ABC transporter substrate-binding protein [Bartonella sp. HY329]UXN10860.1 branched-chain amino acid ABC transporter substrate-binding protein [Bartonella sp. HY328]
MKKFLLATLATASLFFTAQANAEDIKIGLMTGLTGPYASEGQDMKRIIELMVEDINAKGGINGDKIKLIIEDDGSTPATAATAATRLVTAGVPAVIGTYGSAITEASQDIYDEAGVVQIGTGSTSIRLTEKGYERFFRTAPRDDEQGRVAEQSINKLGFKKVAILHDSTAYAKGLADELKAEIEKQKREDIVFFDALVPGESDYSVVLTKIKSENPDVIFFTGYYPEVGLLLRQKKEMGWDVPIIGGDASNHVDLVKIAGNAAAKGYRFVSPPMPADLDTPVTKAFLASYEAKYGSAPGSIWSIAGGDALIALVDAIKAKGTDSEAIADYLHNDLKDVDVLSGKISFNEKGDRVGDLYRLYEIDENGKFVIQPQ